MPRMAREKCEYGIYHVMLRGINRQVIFEDDEDCEKYLQCVADCKEKSGFILYAYCLMGNHIHLLLKEGAEPLSQIFKRIGAKYVFWYNWKYKRSGHLFQDRYKSEAIKDDAHFLAVLRYIYQNPVKASICKKPQEYRWSSYGNLGKGLSLADHNRLVEYMPEQQLRTFVEIDTAEQYLDLAPDLRITDREATELVKEICGIKSLTAFQLLSPEKQDEGIKTLHDKGCSIRQLARLTGVTKGRVERMLK